MLPGIYEFRWDAGHVIFVGIFLLVLASLATSTFVAYLRARRDFFSGHADELRWHEDFEALPHASRKCRHELSGDVRHRECERGFDCRTCATHKVLEANAMARAAIVTDESATPRTGAPLVDAPGVATPALAAGMMTAGDSAPATTAAIETVQGLRVPLDRFYDRRHTWAQVLPNGHVRLGLDTLAERVLGKPDAVTLPAVGAPVHVHGTAWRVWKRGTDVRITSPVDGKVTAVGGPERGWYVEIEPEGTPDLTHLLRGREVRPWMLREVERLQALVATSAVGVTLADGGERLPDPAALEPDADWEIVWDDLFLQA